MIHNIEGVLRFPHRRKRAEVDTDVPVIEINNLIHTDPPNHGIIASLIKKHVLRLCDLHQVSY